MEESTGGLDPVQSAGSYPVSHAWLCSLGGGEIRGRLNLGNLFRDFQSLLFPNSSSFLWLGDTIPPDLLSSFLALAQH